DDGASLLEAYLQCDAVIIGSPAYYRNVTAQLKALFDRSYSFGRRKPLVGKPGGAIAVGRGEGGGQSLVLSIIYNYFLSMGAICVPGELNGLSARADGYGDIIKQERRLRQAGILGENILKFASLLRGR
ncbi:MAG: flavodoxin family protein, partial [Ruminiclostridium sp.]|nr:flavodoxin family protein [Ruminiclostridium sp.]